MPSSGGNPWNISQFDVGFRPTLVKLDTAAITAAESFLEKLQEELLAPHEEAISQAESHPETLSGIYHAIHNDTIGSAESAVANHTADWNAALNRDVDELQLVEQWLARLPRGVIPPIVHLGNPIPEWMIPIAGDLPEETDSGSTLETSITNPIINTVYDEQGNPVQQQATVPMQSPGMSATVPITMPHSPPLGGFVPMGPERAGPIAAPITGGIPGVPALAPGGSVPGMASSGPSGPSGERWPMDGVSGMEGGIDGSSGVSGVAGDRSGIPGDDLSAFSERQAREEVASPSTTKSITTKSSPIVISAPGGVLRIVCECASSPCSCAPTTSSQKPSSARAVAAQLLAAHVAETAEQHEATTPPAQEQATNPPPTNAPAPIAPAQEEDLGTPKLTPEQIAQGPSIRYGEEKPIEPDLRGFPKSLQLTGKETPEEINRAAQIVQEQTTPTWIYHPEWTERFRAGVAWLQEFGDGLLNAGANDTSYQHVTRMIANLMLMSVNNRKDLLSALDNATEKYNAELLSAKILKFWIDESHRGWTGGKDHLAQLYAADHFLRMMEEWAVHVGLSDNYSDTVNLDIGGEVGGTGNVKGPDVEGKGSAIGTASNKTGAGFGHHRHKGWEWRIGTSIHFAIVPLRKIAELAIRYEEQIEPIGAETALTLFVRGFVTEEWAATIVRAHGHDWENYKSQISIEQERLLPEQVIEYARRTGRSREWIDSHLQSIGWYDPHQRDWLNYLYDEVPTLADHLHWLQRNVFDKDYVNEFKLLEGFEEKFWPEFKDDLHALGTTKRTAAYHYAAHWLVPPQEQLARLMQRLRPGRVGENVQVSKEQYLKALAEQDVAPFWRERFYETAFKPLQLRFIRQLYFDGQITTEEVSQLYQDIGYKPEDGNKLAASEAQRKARSRAINGHGFSIPTMRKYYVQGLMTADEIAKHMVPQGYTQQEVDDLIATCKMDQAIAVRKTKIQANMIAYRNFAIDLITLQSNLSKLHLPFEQVQALVELAEARGQKHPSKTTVSEYTALMQTQVKADADKTRAAQLLIAHLHSEMISAKKESHKKRYQALIKELQRITPLELEMPSSEATPGQALPLMPPSK